MKIWLAVLLTASSLDVLTTMIGLRGGAHELNPIMAGIMGNVSELAAYGFKVLIVAGMIAIVFRARRHHRHVWPFQVITALPVSLVVVSNVMVVVGFLR